MTPEIESLVQQLIEAAPDVPTSWCPLLSIEERRSLDRWRSLANPATITAVILAFREELKQARRDALESAENEAHVLIGHISPEVPIDYDNGAEELGWDQACKDIATAIRSLMGQP